MVSPKYMSRDPFLLKLVEHCGSVQSPQVAEQPKEKVGDEKELPILLHFLLD